MRLYNTLTREKEEFLPVEKGLVRIYNCGPTVYSYAHIGNMRSFLFADLLRRYLEYKGLEVIQVMNITDVGHLTEDDIEQGEDKMVSALKSKSGEKFEDIWELAQFYISAFYKDLDTLRIERATQYPRATEHIPEMIEQIKQLLDNGHAYETKSAVYYDVSSFTDYGKLSGNLDNLEEGVRVEVEADKKNPRDFALWKKDDKHLMQWDSPWGRGFPGWHIECSAMSLKYLGNTFDIHTGGVDNKFPHHECEIAQAEGATGKTFVNTWMHGGYLLVNGEKMAKSKGNFFTIQEICGTADLETSMKKGLTQVQALRINVEEEQVAWLLEEAASKDTLEDVIALILNSIKLSDEQGKKVKQAIAKRGDPLAYRYLIQSNHYKSQLNFSLDSLDAAHETVRRLQDFYQSIAETDSTTGDGTDKVQPLIDVFISGFEKAMDDDLDVTHALPHLHKLVKEVNKLNLSKAGAELVKTVLDKVDHIFKVFIPNEETGDGEEQAWIERLIAERAEARAKKDFAEGDRIRDTLSAKGILLEDKEGKTTWKRI